MLSIYDISVYENGVVPTIVPEIVSASDWGRSLSIAAASREAPQKGKRFFSEPCIPANTGTASVCSPELPTRSAAPTSIGVAALDELYGVPRTSPGSRV